VAGLITVPSLYIIGALGGMFSKRWLPLTMMVLLTTIIVLLFVALRLSLKHGAYLAVIGEFLCGATLLIGGATRFFSWPSPWVYIIAGGLLGLVAIRSAVLVFGVPRQTTSPGNGGSSADGVGGEVRDRNRIDA
jgi:hypothetical protein